MAREQKNCPCLQKIREAVIEDSKDLPRPTIGVVFDLSNIIRFDGKGMAKTGQQVWLTEEITKKNGDKVRKDRRSYITHIYCPFCGKKFK